MGVGPVSLNELKVADRMNPIGRDSMRLKRGASA
jgi:hypothetical protein